MGIKLEFKQDAISEGKKSFNYGIVQISQEQRQIVLDAAKIFVQHLPFDETPMAGHILIAMRKYQEMEKIDISQIQTLPVAQQIEQVRGVHKMLKSNLTRFLIKTEMEPLLNDAINTAEKFVLKRFEDLQK
ncbi:MAG: hypothetical protein ACFFAO_20470 [Candidatus Hermodarchaeota archaeon]